MDENFELQNLPVNSYFYFHNKFQIRKKISKSQYIWISDYNKKYCNSLEDEKSQFNWKISPIIKKISVVKISFNYPK